MNYRISKKIYKSADLKLKSFIAANHDKRTTYDIAKEENILSGLERSIFNKALLNIQIYAWDKRDGIYITI